MTDFTTIVGKWNHTDHSETTVKNTETIQDETQVKEKKTKGSGYHKVNIKLNGEIEAPTDNGLSSGPKTPEQEANLAKLFEARNFMKTEEGAKLAKSMLDQQGDISSGQRKWLKKQGIDADAFVQEWNKANPNSANNKTHNAQQAENQRDEMGVLANAHLSYDTEELPQNRADKKNIEVRNKKPRSFFQKLFTKKEKQIIADDKKYADIGGAKVNLHSAQEAQRAADYIQDVSDDMAQAGNEYLEAFDGRSGGKKTKTFKEIDENGNIVKTKVVYNKDGSAKKVVTQSDSAGKLVVKEAKDGDITIKGNLQSDWAYEKNADVHEVFTTRNIKERETITNNITDRYERDIIKIEHCDENEPVVPPVPDEKDSIQGGLVMDFVNDQNPNGIGTVQGSTIRTEFKNHGAQAMAVTYCGYIEDADCPEQAKKMWPKNTAYHTNNYNGEHLAKALINDDETKKVNETDIAALISTLRSSGSNAALSGVKKAITSHNSHVIKLAKGIDAYDEKTGNIDLKKMEDAGLLYDAGTRTVNRPVTASNIEIAWLLQQKNL